MVHIFSSPLPLLAEARLFSYPNGHTMRHWQTYLSSNHPSVHLFCTVHVHLVLCCILDRCRCQFCSSIRSIAVLNNTQSDNKGGDWNDPSIFVLLFIVFDRFFSPSSPMHHRCAALPVAIAYLYLVEKDPDGILVKALFILVHPEQNLIISLNVFSEWRVCERTLLLMILQDFWKRSACGIVENGTANPSSGFGFSTKAARPEPIVVWLIAPSQLVGVLFASDLLWLLLLLWAFCLVSRKSFVHEEY